jgi:hypothetical protein
MHIPMKLLNPPAELLKCHIQKNRTSGRVLRDSVELPLAGVHFFPMRTNMLYAATQDSPLDGTVD